MITTEARLERLWGTLAEAYSAGSIPDDEGKPRPVAPDGVDEGQGRALAELVAGESASRTIEVGFALGLSAAHICAGLLQAGADDARHVALDPTERVHWRGAGIGLLERAGVADMVELIEEESSLALPRLAAEGRTFDLAYIDGDHRFDPVLIDIFFAIRMVRPGGLILLDDMWMAPVRLAAAYFETNLELELLPDACEDAFSWDRRRRRKGVPAGSGRMAVMRTPDPAFDRPWDHFTEFF